MLILAMEQANTGPRNSITGASAASKQAAFVVILGCRRYRWSCDRWTAGQLGSWATTSGVPVGRSHFAVNATPGVSYGRLSRVSMVKCLLDGAGVAARRRMSDAPDGAWSSDFSMLVVTQRNCSVWFSPKFSLSILATVDLPLVVQRWEMDSPVAEPVSASTSKIPLDLLV